MPCDLPADIFQYLKNLRKTKIVARREGRWTRVSGDQLWNGNFFYYCSRSVISTRLSSYKSRGKINLNQNLIVLVMTNLLH